MLFTEEWLRQYCNPQLSTEELAETLTMAGLEVEEVTSVAPAFTGVVVAEVLTCRDHENSDHLHVCEVNAGTGETLQIVCGAPNVRAGIKVACATIGAVLPGDFKIKKSKLRGVVSMGMLCSARELGISEEHNGFRKTRRSARTSASTPGSTTPRSRSSSRRTAATRSPLRESPAISMP